MQESDLDLLIRAARGAGPIATAFTRDRLDIVDKADNQGPVTAADLAVNAHLSNVLRSARPDYGWLSEESPDDTARLSCDTVFIVDPIDGTRAFIDGSKAWAHSIAIARDGVVTAGVVYVPMLDRMYAAALGAGATLNQTPIKVGNTQTLSDAEVLTHKATLNPEHWSQTPPFTRTFRSSLAYRLALVAQGRFDAMMTLRAAWEWDIAAGSLIVSEAAGTATDRRGATLRFNNPHPQQDGVIAANAALNGQIRDLLAD